MWWCPTHRGAPEDSMAHGKWSETEARAVLEAWRRGGLFARALREAARIRRPAFPLVLAEVRAGPEGAYDERGRGAPGYAFARRDDTSGGAGDGAASRGRHARARAWVPGPLATRNARKVPRSQKTFRMTRTARFRSWPGNAFCTVANKTPCRLCARRYIRKNEISRLVNAATFAATQSLTLATGSPESNSRGHHTSDVDEPTSSRSMTTKSSMTVQETARRVGCSRR